MDIDLVTRPAPWVPARAYAALEPVFWSKSLGGWVITSHALVKTVFINRKIFTSQGIPIAEAFGAEAMLTNDDALHNRMRAVWADALSARSVAARGAEIERVASRLLAAARARLAAGETVDVMPVFLDFTTELIMAWMDFPAGRQADVQRWNNAFVDAPALAMDRNSPAYARHMAMKAVVYEFLHAEIGKRRARLQAGQAASDLVALMTAAIGRDGITEANAADNLMNLFLGALDTTTKWLGNAVLVLKREAVALDAILADRRLLAPALEEVMRLETVAQILLRNVREDAAFGGHRLRAGQPVYVMPGAANHDPSVYEAPERFDPRRDTSGHLGFGFGMHQCIGAHIARQEVLHFIGLMLEMLPGVEIAACDYAASWAVWGPTRLALRAMR